MLSTSASLRRVRVRTVLAIVAGTALMALGAQVSLPVPFSAVPITGQTFVLPLVVALLGTRAATLSLVLYLAEGALGLPVFAPAAGTHGALAFFGPTGGYLIAFPVAAFLIGWLFDRGLWSSYAGRVGAIFIGSLVVFASGAAWLEHFVGWPLAWATGVAPFLVGDALKVLLAAAVAPWVRSSPSNLPSS